MRLLSVLLFAILLAGCEDDQSDTTPPTVSISSPVSGQTVFEIVIISVTTQDNEGVSRVQFFVDDSLESTDSDSPFEYTWNTTQYANGSEHVVSVISYDTSDNSTESQPILLIVDNTNACPESVDVLSVDYDFEYMTVIWGESNASDFGSYKLLHAEQEDSDRDTVVTVTEIGITSHQLTEFDPTHPNYFWMMVSDTLGLHSIGQPLSNQIDEPPAEPVLYPIVYEDGQFQITWSQNHDDDFESYRLYESESPSMGGRVIIHTTTNRADTSFVQPISENEIRYYYVRTRDFWGLTEESDIQRATSYIVFIENFGGDEDERGRAVKQVADGGFVVVGHTQSFAADNSDIWMIKTDEYGNEEWNQTIDIGLTEIGYSFDVTTDGGYVITGEGSGEVILVKTDLYGNEEWSRHYYGESGDCGWSVIQTDDGGYIIAGESWSYGNGRNDAWIIKTDSNGYQSWNRTFGGTDDDYARCIRSTGDGGYIIAGETESFSESESDVWLIKTDIDGYEIWSQTFNRDEDRGYSIDVTDDGGYIIAGWTWTGTPDAWLIKTDSSGGEEWNQVFGGNPNSAGAYSVMQTNDGGYIVTGYRYDDEIWLIKTDSFGNEEWSYAYGSEEGLCVQQTTDDGYVIVGYEDVSSSNEDIVLIKTDPEGYTVSSQ